MRTGLVLVALALGACGRGDANILYAHCFGGGPFDYDVDSVIDVSLEIGQTVSITTEVDGFADGVHHDRSWDCITWTPYPDATMGCRRDDGNTHARSSLSIHEGGNTGTAIPEPTNLDMTVWITTGADRSAEDSTHITCE